MYRFDVEICAQMVLNLMDRGRERLCHSVRIYKDRFGVDICTQTVFILKDRTLFVRKYVTICFCVNMFKPNRSLP